MLAAFGFVLAAAVPALAQSPLPPIHPNDLNTTNAQQRSDEIRRSGNAADYGQMNALDSTLLQSRNMNDAARITGGSTSLSPIQPDDRRPSPPPAPGLRPGERPWQGYPPCYLPRQ